MLTISLLLALLALGCTLAAAAGKLPLWIAVLFLALGHLAALLPVRVSAL